MRTNSNLKADIPEFFYAVTNVTMYFGPFHYCSHHRHRKCCTLEVAELCETYRCAEEQETHLGRSQFIIPHIIASSHHCKNGARYKC
mmetsp:Transcript_22931/g.41422  ORF Transcript_22931/g.41422 Transcript_22931/m.41422 type:complete len:87 (+) Transcript_22931:917-1177(+)